MKESYKNLSPTDRVIKAGLAIMSTGERPTLESIRHQIGGSSNSTINENMPALWKHVAQGIEQSQRLFSDLDDQVQVQFQEAMSALVKSLTESARNTFEEDRNKYLADIQAERVAAQTKAAEVAELQLVMESVQRQLDDARDKNNAYYYDVERLKSEISDLKEYYDEVKDQKRDLELTIGRKDADLRVAVAHQDKQTHAIQRMEKDIESLTDKNRKLMLDAEAATSALNVARAKHDEALRLADDRTQIARSEGEKARISEARANDKADRMERQLADAAEAHEKELGLVRGELKTALDRNRQLERENAAAQAIMRTESLNRRGNGNNDIESAEKAAKEKDNKDGRKYE